MVLSSSSPSRQWLSLPVEIQLAITQLLDLKTLHSLSLVSHYNRTLCLPAIYNVRGPVLSYGPAIILIYHRPVDHNIVVRQAPTLCGSRASRPCATHSRTRHQHRRQHLKYRCHHTRGVFRRTRSNPFPRSPSPDALSPPLHRIIPPSDIFFFQG